ncbi:MAG: HAD family hydrolase [Armatimonadota bacterium]
MNSSRGPGAGNKSLKAEHASLQSSPRLLSSPTSRLSASAVIFDIGSTLVTGPEVAPNKVIAGLLGNVATDEVASVIMTAPFAGPDEVCAALERKFGTLSPGVVIAIRDLWNAQATSAREIDGASGTVLALKQNGLKVGLLSDIWSPYYASVRKAIPRVIEAADSIVLSLHTGFRKPEPANFVRALQELQVEPQDAVMVGDTYEHDILPAMRLGMCAVWVLARPERELGSVVRVLNGEAPAPNLVIPQVTGLTERLQVKLLCDQVELRV